MKKKIIIILCTLAVIITLIGIFFLTKNIAASKNKIEILDATFNCVGNAEKFYEDNQYTYSFPCSKKDSIYVKFSNGNKMLVVQALEEEKVTIEELIKAGLEVSKESK